MSDACKTEGHTYHPLPIAGDDYKWWCRECRRAYYMPGMTMALYPREQIFGKIKVGKPYSEAVLAGELEVGT